MSAQGAVAADQTMSAADAATPSAATESRLNLFTAEGFREWTQWFQERMTAFMVNLMFAVIILVVGWVLITIIIAILRRILRARSRLDGACACVRECVCQQRCNTHCRVNFVDSACHCTHNTEIALDVYCVCTC